MGFRKAKIKTNTKLYCYILKASALNYFCPYAAIFYSSSTEIYFFFLQEYLLIVSYVFLNTGIILNACLSVKFRCKQQDDCLTKYYMGLNTQFSLKAPILSMSLNRSLFAL